MLGERAARASPQHAASGGQLSTYVEEDGAEEEEAYLREAELPWQVAALPPP